MKLRQLALVAALAISTGPLVGAAAAQTKVYVVNEDVVRRDSKIGKDIAEKLGSIQTDGITKLGLQTLSQEIKTEQEALKPQTQSLTQEALNANPTLKARVEALAKKQTEYLQKADFLNSKLDEQTNAAMVAFAAAVQPAVDYVAKEVGADIVLPSTSAWYFKNTTDISARVVARLDATTPTLAALQTAAQARAATPAAN
jgi:Skp family chaperone for outer membrane proteins